MEPKYVDESVEFDGAIFKTRSWKASSLSTNPSIKPIADIIFIHGFSEHASKYNEFAGFLSSKGYNFFFYDQRGFGETCQNKKDIAKTTNPHQLKDADFFVKRILDSKDYTGKLYLIGHSMGGASTLQYSIMGKYRDQLKGIASSSPLIIPYPEVNPNFFIRNIILPIASILFPFFHMETGLTQYLTHNPTVREEFLTNKLSPCITTFKQLYDMITLGIKLTKIEFTKTIKGDLPVLIQQGTDDRVCDINGARLFIKHGFKNVKLIEYPGAYHFLYCESEKFKKIVFEDLIEFLTDPQALIDSL